MKVEKKTAEEKEALDKRSGDANTKAKPINYPEGSKKKQQTAENPSGDDKPKVKKENKEIEFYFTPIELQEKGKKLAIVLQDKAKIEDEKKHVADGFKSQIDAKQTEIDILIEQLTIGMERKNVIVEVRRNFESGLREYWYKDEKRGEEPLTKQDHQLDLDLAIAGNLEAEKKDKPFDLKLAANDWIVTKKGMVVMITADDVLNGIKTEHIERLATEDEIKKGETVKA